MQGGDLMISKKLLLLAAILMVGASAWAQELTEGTVINAANLDSMLPKSFEGKSIDSMLPDTTKMMIRQHGLTITLRRSEKVPVDPRWVQATQKYAKEVSYDPKTRKAVGYKAGLAFPGVSLDDPYAAEKLMWNSYYIFGWPRGMLANYPLFAFLFIDGDKGLERVQHWALIRYFMKG